MATTKTASRSRNALDDKSGKLTDEELAAARERTRELKAEARRSGTNRADGEKDLLAKLAEMPDADRRVGERLHALISANVPALWPKTWYGMPAYTKDGKVICHFQSADKFKSRYATFGFSDEAKLDDGEVWPVAWALRSLTPTGEKLIVELVKKAVS